MINRIVACAVSATVLVFAGTASAAELCQPPGPPPDQSLRPTRPVKPVTPPCINPTTHISSCKTSVLNAFNASVNDYNAKLAKFGQDADAYGEALRRWEKTAIDYGNCEVNLLNRDD